MNENSFSNSREPEKINYPEQGPPEYFVLDEEIASFSFERKSQLDKEIKAARRLFSHIMSDFNKNKNFEKTIERLEDVMRIDPAFIEAYYNRGTLLSQLKKDEQAIQDFETVLILDKKHEHAMYNLANIYFYQKQFQKALELFEKVTELNPKSADAIYNMAFINMHHYNKLDLAKEQFQKVYELDSRIIDARTNLGIINYKQGNTDKAIEIFEDIVREIPEHFLAHYNLAIIYKEIGHKDKELLEFKLYLTSPHKNLDQTQFYNYAKRRVKELQEEYSSGNAINGERKSFNIDK